MKETKKLWPKPLESLLGGDPPLVEEKDKSYDILANCDKDIDSVNLDMIQEESNNWQVVKIQSAMSSELPVLCTH